MGYEEMRYGGAGEDLTSMITAKASQLFGIRSLKPYQLLVIQRIIEQESDSKVRDQIVILPTGTGKSLCFLLPAVMCSGITVVVYPLLALMNDQMAKLRESNIRCASIRGGQTKEERLEAFRSLKEGTRILATTPESLQNESVLSQLQRFSISLLVVDEAHVIAQWGHCFRPAYLSLTNAVRRLRPHQTLAFTATASQSTIKDIRTCLFSSKPLIVRGDADRPNIIYRSHHTLNRAQGLIELVRLCAKPAIVFCGTRRQTKGMCTMLRMECPTIPMMYYNAGLERNEREAVEDWFMKSEDGVLLTTSAYGMGVDKRNVRTVVHYSLPSSIEEYLQESGRAGRDGETANAFALIAPEDRAGTEERGPVADVFIKRQCRRKALLSGIGQYKDECTGCDHCLGGSRARYPGKATEAKRVADAEIVPDADEAMDAEREILMLIRARPFKYNSMMAAYILTNCRNIHMNQLQAIDNPLYGCLTNWNPRLLQRTIEYLADEGSGYPISSVPFFGHGKLLYPCDHLLYNLIADMLRRLDDGYRWIVREKG